MTRRVKLRPRAPHVPAEHRGDTGLVVETKELSFGREWLLVEFEDGCRVWTTEERVEEVGA